jgi:DNA-binding CsgD family transcriptional regulator
MRGRLAQEASVEWAGAGSVSTVPLPGPLASARDRPWPLLGRAAELEAIGSAWGRVVEGGRETVLVAGEPGAGKSRLVAEAGRAAHDAGALVLYGSGEGVTETPYAPFVAALGHLNRHASGPLLEDLRKPPLGALISDAAADEQSPRSLGDDRGRLFAAGVDLLERFAERRPLLLAIDDLHGCGPSTLALVQHLASTAAPLRLLLLVTYRPTDVDADGDGAMAIAALRSAPGAQHLQLGALEEPALRDIARALDVAGDPEGLDRAVALTLRESGGNPLFASELLRAMADAGTAVQAVQGAPAPHSLRVLIAARCQALGAPVHEHLAAAAVCGREFDPGLVAAALDLEPAELAASIGAAQRAGLVEMDPAGGGCAFSHAVAARCLYDEAGPERRGSLHRRIAELLEQRVAPAERAAELARHWLRADPPDPERAARWCAVAGEVALRRYDHEVAAGWFERALELREGSGEAGGEADRCDLLIGLGEALRYSNQERSRELLLEASRLADERDDVERLVAAVLANHRGFVSHVGSFDRERGAMLRRAAERLGPAVGPELALVLAQLALELTFSPQVERRRRLAERALAMARSGGDRRVLAQVLIRYLIARWGPENPEERIATAAESIEIGARLDQPLELFHAMHWQAAAQIEVGRIAAAAQTLREQERIAERVGDGTATWLCDCATSLHLALRGRLEEAEQRAQSAAERATSSAQPDALPFYVSQIASIRWQQGRLAELAPLLAETLDQYPGLPAFRSLVTLAHAVAGDHAFAREVLATDTATGFAELPRDPVWIAGAATYAHAVVELGDRDAAAVLHPILAPFRGQLATTTISVWGLVDHALGRLELLLGEEAAGCDSLTRAIDRYAAMAAPLWQAQAERDREAAGVSAADLRLEARIESLGLTSRQAEVTMLIAQGRSNREIAEMLQISSSTVKRHLENVFERTGARSRGALTALLLE